MQPAFSVKRASPRSPARRPLACMTLAICDTYGAAHAHACAPPTRAGLSRDAPPPLPPLPRHASPSAHPHKLPLASMSASLSAAFAAAQAAAHPASPSRRLLTRHAAAPAAVDDAPTAVSSSSGSSSGCDDSEGNLIIHTGDMFVSSRPPSRTCACAPTDACNHPLSAGRVHRYMAVELLGSGSFGTVVKCVEMSESGAPVSAALALKVVRNHPAYFTQASMEIQILHILSPRAEEEKERHTIALRDHFLHASHLCLVFDYMPLTLLDVLSRTRYRGLPLTHVREMLTQLLQALHSLHAKGLIHADIKLENIMLGAHSAADAAAPGASPMHLRVIDFGSSALEGTLAFHYIQSRYYRAPEAMCGVLPVSSAIDIWSAACVAAEMYMGLPLFPGAHEQDMLARITHMCGPLPDWMCECGSTAQRFYTATVAATHAAFHASSSTSASTGEDASTHGIASMSVSTTSTAAAAGARVSVPSLAEAPPAAAHTRIRRAHSDGATVSLPPTAHAVPAVVQPMQPQDGEMSPPHHTARAPARAHAAFKAPLSPRASESTSDSDAVAAVTAIVRALRCRMPPVSPRARISRFRLLSPSEAAVVASGSAAAPAAPLPAREWYPVSSLRELILGHDAHIGMIPHLRAHTHLHAQPHISAAPIMPPASPSVAPRAAVGHASPHPHACVYTRDFTHDPFRTAAHRMAVDAASERIAFLDLLTRMLDLNPAARITAAQALMHPFFITQRMDPHAPADAASPGEAEACVLTRAAARCAAASRSHTCAAAYMERGWTLERLSVLGEEDAHVCARKGAILAAAARKSADARARAHTMTHATTSPAGAWSSVASTALSQASVAWAASHALTRVDEHTHGSNGASPANAAAAAAAAAAAHAAGAKRTRTHAHTRAAMTLTLPGPVHAGAAASTAAQPPVRYVAYPHMSPRMMSSGGPLQRSPLGGGGGSQRGFMVPHTYARPPPPGVAPINIAHASGNGGAHASALGMYEALHARSGPESPSDVSMTSNAPHGGFVRGARASTGSSWPTGSFSDDDAASLGSGPPTHKRVAEAAAPPGHYYSYGPPYSMHDAGAATAAWHGHSMAHVSPPEDRSTLTASTSTSSRSLPAGASDGMSVLAAEVSSSPSQPHSVRSSPTRVRTMSQHAYAPPPPAPPLGPLPHWGSAAYAYTGMQ